MDVDLELLRQPGQVDIHVDPLRRNTPKSAPIVSVRRCFEEPHRAAATASRLRPNKELTAALADKE